jgi:diadenosine tetraphosphate (Ap4A) HIT family hydrolase
MSLCPFCNLDRSKLIVESEVAFALLDAFPVTEGHTLIVPRRHVTSIFQLSPQDLAALWAMVGEVRQRLQQNLAFDGVNVGVNDGSAAGQTVEHAHIHLIPRINGDVQDPRGGVRNIIPSKARYWEN